MSREYPFTWIDIPAEEVKETMIDVHADYIRSVPGDVWMPKKYRDVAERIYNFKVRPDDVWIVTYPKCGTTWTQELIWHIANNVDIEGSKMLPLYARSPFLDCEAILPDEAKPLIVGSASEDKKKLVEEINFNSIGYAENLPSPRIIKCHMPISMLPPELFTTEGCKVVYVCRNPKDACVSYFHHHKIMFPNFSLTFNKFEEMYMKGTLDYGSYWFHIKDALKYRSQKNFKIVWFEEMKKDLIAVIRDMSKFLGYHLTELKVLTLDDHLYIGNLRKHGAENMSNGNEMTRKMFTQFFRKGQVGDWKNYFGGEKLSQWDQWIADNLQGTDLEMAFE